MTIRRWDIDPQIPVAGKQEGVAKALLSGLAFTKGVPLTFRSDEAPEFVDGVVSAMNACLGVTQIATGGHNARGNAIVPS
jgi:hypothetical protein